MEHKDAEPASSRSVEASGADTAQIRREDFGLAAPFMPATSAMERRLKTIWESALDISGLGVEDDYFELGGDSMIAVAMFAEMESVFGPMPPLSTLLDCPTIRKLARHLEGLGAQVPDGAMLAVQRQGRRLPLFYTHATFGNVLYVRRLTAFLIDQPLYAIQARGLQDGEKAHQSFEAMAADYCAIIRRAQPKGPYVLAGHCVGGLIAHAMAQHLRSEGEEVAALIMIDPDYHPHAVPWMHWRNPSALHVRLWCHLLRPFWFARLWLRRLAARLRGEAFAEPVAMSGTQRQRRDAVRLGVRAALRAYRPRVYDSPTFIICSAERRRLLAKPNTGWPSWAPKVKFLDISASHDEFFVGALPEVGTALEQILASIQPPQAEPQAPARNAAE